MESAPLVRDGKVYFGSSDCFVYALDAKDGKLLGKFETEDRVLGAPNFFSPRAKTAKPSLIVGSYDFKLYAFDPVTGKKKWDYETSNYINGSPAVFSGGQRSAGATRCCT